MFLGLECTIYRKADVLPRSISLTDVVRVQASPNKCLEKICRMSK